MAARLVGLSTDRVRRWLRGYEYKYFRSQPVMKKQDPVIQRSGAAGSSYASFLDLIDILFVKKFIESGISLQKLRLALQEAEEILGGQHHFAQRKFWTDGHNIYLQVQDRADAILQLLANGQWVIAPIIVQTAKHIDFSEITGYAERWYPLGRNRCVVLNPKIAFGSPSIIGKGIETANVYDLYKAESENVEAVCSWMGITKNEVKDAVEFEQLLAAA